LSFSSIISLLMNFSFRNIVPTAFSWFKILPFSILSLTFIHKGTTAQINPWQAISGMQKGINLGNTLEAPYEGNWNPPAQEYYFDLFKAAGFKCVRVPVRWDNHTGTTPPYKIDETWLQRVETVLDWGLERDLFVVVNAHHDDWIKQNYSDPAIRARFDSVWSQISVRFKDKPEKLIFEILNEPYGLTKEQNDEMHQRILSIIRKTNPTRIVIFQGHEWGGSDELITAAIPDDDYVIGSFHSYDPYEFGLLGEGTWGTSYDVATLKNKFISVKNWSDLNNIPVFMGEFGSVRSCDYNSRMKHYKTYVELAQNYGFAYCAWDNGVLDYSDNGLGILDRAGRKWDEIKDILIYSSARSPANPTLTVLDTIIKLSWINTVIDNDSIFVQRRLSNENYTTIARLKGDTTIFYDVNTFPNIYFYYRIIAHYNSGEEIYSHPVRIFMPIYVPKERGFFLGVPATIPGIIEAENYDIGGEGLTYHETDDVNIAGAYRPDEAVDIYDRLGDGYHIGNAIPGEWYEYTVNVQHSGEYIMNTWLASLEGGGKFQIKIGEVESDTLTAPVTYSALNTASVSAIMNLDAGEQIMRFTVISLPIFNIDKIVFESPEATEVMRSENQSFTVFQNQDRELVFIFDSKLEIRLLKIYNITGSLIFNLTNPENELKISIPGIPEGFYVVKAVTDKQEISRKIIIN
jgi:aryl-phospho-beta-D-glucosidase BglC (GH1 family)